MILKPLVYTVGVVGVGTRCQAKNIALAVFLVTNQASVTRIRTKDVSFKQIQACTLAVRHSVGGKIGWQEGKRRTL